MIDIELLRQFTRLCQANDTDGFRELLARSQLALQDADNRSRMMIDAAMHYPTPEMIAILHEFGVPLDTVHIGNPIDRPLYAAASAERWATMRWLIEHGAEVNWEVPGRVPYCVPMATVIRSGHLETVKLLTDAGAYLNAKDRRDRTPLDWAIAYGQTEIAEFFKSRMQAKP